MKNKNRWKEIVGYLLIVIISATITIFVKRYIQDNYFTPKQELPVGKVILYAEPAAK